MSKAILRALPVYKLADSWVRPGLIRFFKLIAPFYLRFGLRFCSTSLLDAELAIEAIRAFQQGKSRLLICFRHPYGDEPQLIASVLTRNLSAIARRNGQPLRQLVHAHFVHGYEVPLWSDALTRWILPRVGAIPVYHVKFNSASVEKLRSLLLDSHYPVALAPEGQASYVSEALPRLESGFAHLALWCADDLAKAERPETVLVLPLSVHYRYGHDAQRALARLLKTMERDCGLPSPRKATPGNQIRVDQSVCGPDSFSRLKRIAQAIVAEAEAFYGLGTSGQPQPASDKPIHPSSSDQTDSDNSPDSPSHLQPRWQAVLEAALSQGEQTLGLKPNGDLIQRVYSLRQTGWDLIFRAELSSSKASDSALNRRPTPSPLRRTLWDRQAAEAWYAMRHMELADLGYYIDFNALKADDPIERYIESANNYRDLISRLRGGNISDRGNPALKKAVVVAGQALEVKAGTTAKDGRTNRKIAVATLTEQLAESFNACIDRYLKEYRNG